MKKASLLLGIGVLGVILVSFTGTHQCEKSEHDKAVVAFSESKYLFEEGLLLQRETEILEINDIVFIEQDEEIKLDFDTTDYLPLGFNAYEGLELDLNDIIIVEEEEEINLGFDTAQYLPADFNAYDGMEFDIEEIIYIEDEEEIILDFDTQVYLPENFNPNTK